MKTQKTMAVILLGFMVLSIATVAAYQADSVSPIALSDKVSDRALDRVSDKATDRVSDHRIQAKRLSDARLKDARLGFGESDNSDLDRVTDELRTLGRDTDKMRDRFSDLVPTSYDRVAKDIAESDRAHRFILWTHDGKHLMWGTYANGYFIAEDNEGNDIWGIYNDGTFAGFGGNGFFVGKYRSHIWGAWNLFEEGKRSFGQFKTFN
jgi:hypothetical protein